LELPAQPELEPGWREIRNELRRVVGDSTYDIWLSPLKVRAWDGQTLVLEGPASTHAWVMKRFGRVLESSARAVLGQLERVDLEPAGPTSPSAPAGPGPAGVSRVRPTASRPDSTERLNPRYSFDQFIIGDGNRLAHAAALAVAELPGQAYNPLFLHAPPGLGKTHLLHAIGNYVSAFGGGGTVRYTTAEAFTNHFIHALGSRSIEHFKHAYRDADVLLIDDVQFLASKAKTEEEFFHTFNALYETGRQLVLTCDRLPRQLSAIEERLRERFESGLVADIRPPDLKTRLAILRKRAVLDRVTIGDGAVLDVIAERITDNVRALEGALIRVVAHHSLTGRPLDAELARDVLDQIHPAGRASALSIADIQMAVATAYAISVEELVSPGRAARIAWPRQVAIYLARDLTGASLNVIGAAFGGRNHATILHASKRVAERVRTDPEAGGEVDHLVASLKGRRT
jgi:chromosomal replication initiator protein